MSKNMVDYCNDLFSKFANYTGQSKEGMHLKKSTSFQSDKLDFNNIQIVEERFLSAKQRHGYLDLGSARIIFFIGFDWMENNFNDNQADFLGHHFIQKNINDGLFLAIAKDLSIEIKDIFTPQEIEDKVMYQKIDSQYDGNDLSELMGFMEPVFLFEVLNDSVFVQRSNFSDIYYILSFADQMKVLPYTRQVVESFRDLFLSDTKADVELLFFAFSAVNWRYSFLEVYRTLEAVYHIPRALELKREMISASVLIGFSLKADKLSDMCINNLGWRKKETDSLNKLCFLNIGNQKVSLNCNFSAVISGYSAADFSDVKLAEKISEKIYSVRNRVVHYKANGSSHSDFSDVKWNDLLLILLVICKDVYASYDAELS